MACAARSGGDRPSVCFVAPNAYPVLAADRQMRFVGGAEVQQALLATELAARGWRVSMISMDFGQREGDVLRGVRLLKTCRPGAGVPVLRFVHPRLTGMWSAMRRAGADVYYQRAGGMLTGVVAAFAQRHRRASVFAAAHDQDFDPALPLIHHARDKAIFRWGVRRSTRVIVQSERQRAGCRSLFGREAVRIDSAYAHTGRRAAHDGVVLWVANLKRHKRPHLFVELAARLPALRFCLVGGPVDNADERAYCRRVAEQAAAVPNLELTGHLPLPDVEARFDSASVFVNTSVGEGFPNTFLQAWSRQIPTVSFFDPERHIDGQPVGVVVPDIEAMASSVHRLMTDRAGWAESGERCRRAFEASHSVPRVVDEFERVLEAAATAAARGAIA